jgi:hypothetical protein
MRNVSKKYGITDEELQKGIDTIAGSLGKIVGTKTMLAVAELLATGDIA